MAQKFLTNLDLNKNELQNAKIQNLGTAPSSPADGQIYFDTSDNALKIYDGSVWVNLQEGDISGVTAGTGLDGGGNSGAITVNIANTGVSAASYGSSTAIPVLTVNAQGQITAASTSSISTTLDIAADSGTDDGVALGTDTLTIAGGTGLSSAVSGDTITVTLDDTAVSAASYGSATAIPVFTVDAQGRITAASTTAISTTLDLAADTGTDDGVRLGTDTLTIAGGTGLSSSVTGDTITVTMDDTTVSAGSYGSGTAIPVITVDAQGRITSAATSTISTTLDIAADSGLDNGVALGTDTLTIAGGTGLSSAVSGDTVTVNLDATAVTAAAYGSATAVASFTVDAQGRLTAAGDTTIAIPHSQITDFDEAVEDVVAGQIVTNGSHSGISATYDDLGDGAIDISLTNTGVGAATYGDADSVAQVAVDAQGRITSASNVNIAIASSAVTDLSSNAVTALSGTANEVEVSASTGSVTVGLPNDVTIGNDLTVTGDLNVLGTTTTVDTASLSIEDSMIELARNNTSSDTVDIGLYGTYDTSGTLDLYAGLFRDASDNKWKLYVDSQSEPGTAVDTSATGYTVGTLVASLEGDVTGNADTATALETARNINGVSFDGSADITVTAAAGTLTGTTLNSSVVSSSLTSLGTISTGVWAATDVAVAHGGTGASTASSARSNLAATGSGLSGTTLARIAAVDCAADTAGTSATTVTHNFGTEDVMVQVYDTATGATVVGDVVRTSTNVVTVTLLGTITAGDYRIVVTAA